MNILVYGTENFQDYNTYLRGIVVAIESNLDGVDNKINIITAGPRRINSYTAEFVNRSENLMRQKKMKMRFSRARFKDVLDNFSSYNLNYVVSFNTKNDRDKFFDPIIKKAEEFGIESAFYRL